MSRIFRLLAAGLLLSPVVALYAAPPAAAVRTEPALGCAVSYSGRQVNTTFHQAVVTIKNTGTAPIEGWTLLFPLTPAQMVLQAKGATLESTSGTVIAHDIVTNATVRPGSSVTVTFQVSGEPIRPVSFTVNNVLCS